MHGDKALKAIAEVNPLVEREDTKRRNTVAKGHTGRSLLLIGSICYVASAQLPVISPGGVVNAASYAQNVTPGSTIAIFGKNFASGVYSAPTTPLPTSLGNTSVTINGVAAPLFYVSPTQINAQVPFAIGVGLGSLSSPALVVTASSGASAPAAVSVYIEAPGIYTRDGSGCGQAAALNVGPDGSISANSPSNSAAPGDFVTVFGNAFGPFYFPPATGSPAAAAQNIAYGGGFKLDGESNLTAQYIGLAPGLVGTDQANIQIPIGTRNGCAVPLAIKGAYFISPVVSISVNASRGQCSDPPAQSYGTINLVRTISSGTANDGETDTINASFPVGPQLTRPSAESQTLPYPGSYIANVLSVIAPGRSCPVAGYSQLSAGPITVSGPKGSVTAAPTTASGFVSYSKVLPQGFLTGGTYGISASGDGPVRGFQGSFALDPPIQLTLIHRPTASDGTYTVNWTGGAPSSIVKISLLLKTPVIDQMDYTYTTADAGTFSFEPLCSGHSIASGGNGVYCSFGLSGINEIVVEQMSPTAGIPVFQANGVTGDIQISWKYKYIFGIPQS